MTYQVITATHHLFSRVARAALMDSPLSLAIAIKFNVRQDTARRWLSGREVVPDGVWRELETILAEREAECVTCRKMIYDNSLGEEFSTRGTTASGSA